MNPFNISHIFFPLLCLFLPLTEKKESSEIWKTQYPKWRIQCISVTLKQTDSSSSAASPQPASLQRADGRLPGCEYPTSAPHKAANPGSSPGQHFGLSRIPGKCRLCWDADLNQSTIK